MSIKYYVKRIDGDYAILIAFEPKDDEEFIVARALLPENIDEGTKLLFENFVYEIIA
jgi:hypothetical protein